MTGSHRDVFANTGHARRSLKDIANAMIFRIIAPLPDAAFCALKYFVLRGRFPALRHPRTFTDKVQARKLHDRNPLFPTMVDKADAKAMVSARVGPRYTIPTQWVGKALGDVDWSTISLPAVVKPTHASGVGRLLQTQADVDRLLADDPSAQWLAIDHAAYNREWVYRALEPRIIIETMLQVDGQVPPDYRFYTFDGEVSHIEVDFEIDGRSAYCNYSTDWKRLPFHDPDHEGYYPAGTDRPERLDEMIRVAQTLGAGTDFVRVDMYACAQWVRVGELTLYPGGGFDAFDPPEYDLILGEKWRLGFDMSDRQTPQTIR
ncbi:N/A [soil metagenome]